MSFFKPCFSMHIIFVAILITVCKAEKLDRRYLPPPLTAKSAGGDSKDLLTPFPSSNRNTGINVPISSNQRIPQSQNYEGESQKIFNNKLQFSSGPFDVKNNEREPDENFDDNRHQTPINQSNKLPLPSQNNFRSFQDIQPFSRGNNFQTYRNEGQSNFNSLKPSQIDLNRSNPYKNENIHSAKANSQPTFAGTSQDLNSKNGLNRVPLLSQNNQQFENLYHDNRVLSPKQNIYSSEAMQKFNGFPDQKSFSQNDNQNYNNYYSGTIPSHTRENNNEIVRSQAAQERSAEILQLENEINEDGFHFSFETNNGIKAESNGFTSNGVQAQGAYSYIGDDGELYTVQYTADEGGFRPIGAHLPTPPPIPEAILRSLEQNLRDEAAGIEDDGMYDPSKYGDDQYFNPQYSSNNLNTDAGNNIRLNQGNNAFNIPQYSRAKIQSPLNFDRSSRENFPQANPNSQQNEQLRNTGTANGRLPSNAIKQSNFIPISQQIKGKIAVSDENSDDQISIYFPTADTRNIKPEFDRNIKDFEQGGRSFDRAPTMNNRRLPKGPEYLPPKQTFSRPQNGNQPLQDFSQNPIQQYQPSSLSRRVNLMSSEIGSENNDDGRLKSEQPIKSEKQVPNYMTNLNRPSPNKYNENGNTQKLSIPSQTSQTSIPDQFYFTNNVNHEETSDMPCRNKACIRNNYSASNGNGYQVHQPNQFTLHVQNSVRTDPTKSFPGSSSNTLPTQPPSTSRNNDNQIYNYPQPGQQDSDEQYRNNPTDPEKSQYQEWGFSSEPREFNPIESDRSQLSSQNLYIENQQLQDFPQVSFLPESNNKYNLKPQQASKFPQNAGQTQENNYSNDNLNQYSYETSTEKKNDQNGIRRPISEQPYYPFSDAQFTEKNMQNDRSTTINQRPYKEPAIRAQPNQYETSDVYNSQPNNRKQQSASQKQKPQFQDQQPIQRNSNQPQPTTPQESFSYSTTELSAADTEVPTQQYDGELYQYNKPDPVSPERQTTTESVDSTTPNTINTSVTIPDTHFTETIQPSQTNRNFIPDHREEFPRFRQPPRFDDETGYHY